MAGAPVLQVLDGGRVWRGEAAPAAAVPVLQSGLRVLDEALALGGLPVGGVTEVRAGLGHGGLGLGLMAVAALLTGDAQARAAVVDGFGTLHGAAVLEAGVPPGRVWCVRPKEPGRIMALGLRLVRSAAFRLVLVDHALAPPVSQPELAVRRLAVAAQEAGCVVVLLSGNWGDCLGLPLPSALRLRVSRQAGQHLNLAVEKQRGASLTPSVTLPGRLLYSPPHWDLDHAARPGC